MVLGHQNSHWGKEGWCWTSGMITTRTTSTQPSAVILFLKRTDQLSWWSLHDLLPSGVPEWSMVVVWMMWWSWVHHEFKFPCPWIRSNAIGCFPLREGYWGLRVFTNIVFLSVKQRNWIVSWPRNKKEKGEKWNELEIKINCKLQYHPPMCWVCPIFPLPANGT